MRKHYSQQGSDIAFRMSHGGTLLHVCLQGFISSAMLRENWEMWWREVFSVHRVRAVLFDPSEVAGFDSETPELASELLSRTEHEGVQRVAIVSPSSVLRTTIQLLRPRLHVEVGCFISLATAERWLHELVPPSPNSTGTSTGREYRAQQAA